MKAILILFLFPLKIFAQDITGVWTGTLYNDTTRKYNPYEITISEEKGRLSGYSHTTWKPDETDKIVNIGVKAIKLKRKNDKLYVEDEKWLYNNYPEPPPKGVKQFSVLSIETGESGMVLSGPFNTNPTREYAAATGTIRLQKKNDYAASQIIPKLEELKLLNNLTFLPPKAMKDQEVIAIMTKPLEKPTLAPTQGTSTIPAKNNEKEIVKNNPAERISDPDFPKPKDTVENLPALVMVQPVITSQKKELIVANKQVKAPAIIIPAPKKPEVVIAAAKPPVKVPAIAPPKPKEQVAAVVTKPLPKPPVVQPGDIKTNPPEKEIKIVAAVPPKQKEVVLVTPPKIIPISAADLAIRKIETIRSVTVKSDSLVMNLYDNGEIDGDTVSVVLNGKTILSRQGLTANAITKTIYLTPDLGDSIQLIMYAENLGSIPPNTGLLILQDGNDRYEIRFAGDLQKNSAIILKRKH